VIFSEKTKKILSGSSKFSSDWRYLGRKKLKERTIKFVMMTFACYSTRYLISGIRRGPYREEESEIVKRVKGKSAGCDSLFV
jgi:hypothetical protein